MVGNDTPEAERLTQTPSRGGPGSSEDLHRELIAKLACGIVNRGGRPPTATCNKRTDLGSSLSVERQPF
jgi:hypothetical protein